MSRRLRMLVCVLGPSNVAGNWRGGKLAGNHPVGHKGDRELFRRSKGFAASALGRRRGGRARLFYQFIEDADTGLPILVARAACGARARVGRSTRLATHKMNRA
eukprot:4757961-Pleurochrysis_carterae.AAC.1